MSESSGMKDSGERRQFETGAVRDRSEGKPRPDLISPHANLREGAWLALGAKKYQPRNWEAGMPISECIASLSRHLEAYKLGQRDEDHMAAIRTNAGFILHYEEEIKAGRLDPALADMPRYQDRKVPYPLRRRPRTGGGGPDILTPAGLEAKVQAKLDAAFLAETIRIDLAKLGEDETAGCILDSDGRISDGHIYAETSRRDQERVDAAPDGSLVPVEDPASILGRPDFTVYLCGPITGQEVDYTWRQAATAYLAAHGVRTLDPLRGKHLKNIENQGLSYKGQLAAPEIADRDQMDVEECDAVLAHFPYDPPRQSIGSLMEMGAAAIGLRKTVVLCATGQVFNDHLFCRNFCTLEPDFGLALKRIVAMMEARKR